jgi:hypothetical protein
LNKRIPAQTHETGFLQKIPVQSTFLHGYHGAQIFLPNGAYQIRVGPIFCTAFFAKIQMIANSSSWHFKMQNHCENEKYGIDTRAVRHWIGPSSHKSPDFLVKFGELLATIFVSTRRSCSQITCHETFTPPLLLHHQTRLDLTGIQLVTDISATSPHHFLVFCHIFARFWRENQS